MKSTPPETHERWRVPIAPFILLLLCTGGCLDADLPNDEPEFRMEVPELDGEGLELGDEVPELVEEDSLYPDPSPRFEELPCGATDIPDSCPPDDEQPSDDGDAVAGKNCNLGLDPLIYADPGDWTGTTGSFGGIAAGNYRFWGTESSPQAQNWFVAVENIFNNMIIRATQGNPSGSYTSYVSPPHQVNVQIRAPFGAQPGDEHELTVGVDNILGQTVCVDTVTLRVPMDCSQPVDWWDGSSLYPWYDGANCFVMTPPPGTTPFVYANQYYVMSGPSTNCPLGSYDGANCYIQQAPPNAFVYNNNFYTTPLPGPSCPSGSGYDGANCYWYSAPWGTSAFEYAGNWYTTPLPSCAIGSYDGANCWLGTPPPGTNAFLYAGNFYYQN